MAYMQFVDYIKEIHSRRIEILKGTILCVVAAAIVSIFLPNIYRAQSIVYISSNVTITDFGSDGIDVNTAGKEKGRDLFDFRGFVILERIFITAAKEFAKNPEILKDIIERLQLKDITIEELDKKCLNVRIVSEYSGLTTYSNAPFIFLSVEYKDRKIAKDIANAWAEILQQKLNDMFKYRFDIGYRTISERLRAQQDSLAEAERALKDARQELALDFLREEVASKESSYMSISAALDELRIHGYGAATEDKAKEASLSASLEDIKREILELRRRIYEGEYRLSQLERDVALAGMSYELFRKKEQLISIASVENSLRAMIVAAAAEPQKHVRPMRGLIIAIAGCAGCVMMCVRSLINKKHHDE